MKFSFLLLAAGLFTVSAASAQTTPTTSTPGAPTPNAVPSGIAPPPANPKGDVTPGQVFTTGAPQDNGSDKTMKHKHMKMRKHDKATMTDDKDKMKAKSSGY